MQGGYVTILGTGYRLDVNRAIRVKPEQHNPEKKGQRQL